VFLGRSTLAADEEGGNEIDADAGFGAGVGAGDCGESGGEFFDGVFVAESCEAVAAGVDQDQRRSHRCRLLPGRCCRTRTHDVEALVELIELQR
jgi:hypothetical protein